MRQNVGLIESIVHNFASFYQTDLELSKNVCVIIYLCSCQFQYVLDEIIGHSEKIIKLVHSCKNDIF